MGRTAFLFHASVRMSNRLTSFEDLSKIFFSTCSCLEVVQDFLDEIYLNENVYESLHLKIKEPFINDFTQVGGGGYVFC